MVDMILRAVTEFDPMYTPKDNYTQPQPQTQWDVPNSIMFSLTTLTLIGYGNIAPTTTSSRLQAS